MQFKIVQQKVLSRINTTGRTEVLFRSISAKTAYLFLLRRAPLRVRFFTEFCVVSLETGGGDGGRKIELAGVTGALFSTPLQLTLRRAAWMLR